MVPLLLSPRSSLSLPCMKKRNLHSSCEKPSFTCSQCFPVHWTKWRKFGERKGVSDFPSVYQGMQPLAIFQHTPMKPFLWLKYQKKKLLCSSVQTHTSALTVPTKPRDKCINHINFILGKSKITNRQ